MIAAVMSCGDIGVISKTNEWNLLKHQFDALAHEESVGPDSIDTIFDMEFRRRFSELITQTARRNSANDYNWPRYVRPSRPRRLFSGGELEP